MFKVIKADDDDVIIAHYHVPDKIVSSYRATRDWVSLPCLDTSIKQQDIERRLLYTTIPRVLGVPKSETVQLSAFGYGSHNGTIFVWCGVEDPHDESDTNPIHSLTVILPKDMVAVDEEDEYM